MNDRLKTLAAALSVDRYPLCIEKLKIVLETLRATEGQPQVLRRARCLQAVLARIPIFIEPEELIVGNGASQPMGLEIDVEYGVWSQNEIDSLKEDGFVISPGDEALLSQLYEGYMPPTLTSAMGQVFEADGKLWPFMQSGVLLPPWKNKLEGPGGGYAQSGLGLGPGFYLMGVDIARVLQTGVRGVIEQAQAELAGVPDGEADAAARRAYLEAVIIVHEALIGFAARFSALAETLAQDERRPERKIELLRIAETCRQVPANGARNFYQAIQAFWFLFLVINPSTTAAAGRFDQYMHPFYQRDIDAGRIRDDEVLELLACLRIKDMQLNRISGKTNRKKNAGMAKWHNWTIGGVTPDGRDATNALTYLVLEAARLTRLPHHTITLRVHDKTPDDLLIKALEVVKTGLGLPAFVGDRSYIRFFERHGVPTEQARDYIVTGCLDANLPTLSRTAAIGMFVVPLVLDMFLHDGIDPNTGLQVGLKLGDLHRLQSYDEFVAAFKVQLAHFMGLAAEKNNVELAVSRELFPDPLRSSLMAGGIESGRDVLDRTMPFENGAVLNPVGMINVADSLAAIKTLVFEQGAVSLRELVEALDANWRGHEALHAMCLAAPKFGNADERVDAIARDLYAFWAETTATFPTVFGGTHKPTAISITSHQPGGALTGATPDGRHAGDICADGTMSPMQGVDIHGPTRVLRSAMRIDQDPYQATLLNLKLHPSTMTTREDLMKIAMLMKAYFGEGGKHVQFNVVDRQTLIQAQQQPQQHRDLTVRVAGYSAYFVQLGKEMQDEVIRRTEHHIA